MTELENKLAIITRTSSQLAPPVAQALLDCGLNLAAAGDALPGVQAHRFEAETDEAGVRAAVEHLVSEHGAPAVLVTCPPPFTPNAVADLSEAAFRHALEDHLIHAFVWSKVVGQMMAAAGGGVIVHITGLSGMGGWRHWLAQSAAFGGVHNLVHTLAVEWAQTGVRVNALVPGITESTADDIIAVTPNITTAQVKQRIPLERFVDDAAISQALQYLISPDSTFISGEVLRVDGGWDIWGRLYAVARK